MCVQEVEDVLPYVQQNGHIYKHVELESALENTQGLHNALLLQEEEMSLLKKLLTIEFHDKVSVNDQL